MTTKAQPPNAIPTPGHGSDDDIVVVSMACDFPGGSKSPEQFWTLLREGNRVTGDPPVERWPDQPDLFDDDPDATGKAYSLTGGYLSRIDRFDAGFFGIGETEAESMDPQQRVLLQTAWEAIERSGKRAEDLRSVRTGVYIGAYGSGYSSTSSLDDLDGYVGTGSAGSVASGRIAYSLGLTGPAMTIDTACSSSLVALHLATQGLQSRDCDIALVGGVSLLVTPTNHVEFSRMRGLSPSGVCSPFSPEADGVVWAEGAGVLMVRRRGDAVRDGDPILAVVAGSAINQDGRSQGLTAPSESAQVTVVTSALASAGVAPADVDYVEAHGTGTPLGDRIELGALDAVYGQPTDTRQPPLVVGSVKSNLGHMQAAAGIAGIVKVVLALHHEWIPATVGSRTGPLRERIVGSGEGRPWRRSANRPRRAGVSAFGISGTNAHVLIEEPPVPATTPADGRVSTHIVLSARSEGALRGNAAQLGRMIEELHRQPGVSLADVADALTQRRTHFEYRAVVLADRTEQVVDGLRLIGTGEPVDQPTVVRGDRLGAIDGKTVFVFPGQGSQWAGMAVDLLEHSEAFAAELARCDIEIRKITGWSVIDVLHGQGSAPALAADDVVQPALFAVMVSLAAHWQAQGIYPDAVVGHSQGEIAAAYVAGALTLSAAVKVVTTRSSALGQISGSGAMALVGLSADDTEAELAARSGDLSIAATNGVRTTVVAGNERDVADFVESLDRDGVFVRRLAVNYASHSVQVEPLKDVLLQSLSDIHSAATDIAWYSTVDAEVVTDNIDAEYWFDNLREPVRFVETTEQLIRDGHRHFVEMSPHPSLVTSIESVADSLRRRVSIITSLRRDDDGHALLDRARAEYFVAGGDISWQPTDDARRGGGVVLPTYAWDERSYWKRAPAYSAPASLSAGSPGAPLLDSAVHLAYSNATLFSGRISPDRQTWIADHAVSGIAVLPGTAYIDIALAALRESGATAISELTLHSPLAFGTDNREREIQAHVADVDGLGQRLLRIHSRTIGSQWELCAEGVLDHSAATVVDPAPREFAIWPPIGARSVDLTDAYDILWNRGYEYGQRFRGLSALWQRGETLYAELRVPEGLSETDYSTLHPAILDSALHALALVSEGKIDVPYSWSGVRYLGPDDNRLAAGDRLRVILHRTTDENSVRLILGDSAGRVVADVDSLVVRAISAHALLESIGETAVFETRWREADSTAPQEPVALTPVEVIAIPAVDPAQSPERAIKNTREVLEKLNSSLAQSDSNIVVVTANAVGTGGDAGADGINPNAAAVWGLIRSAQNEYPGRITLVDTDGSVSDQSVVQGASRYGGGAQLAAHAGTWLIPEVVRAPRSNDARDRLAPLGGTAVVTGGTGGLGRLFSRHLVERHGVERVISLSRRGPDAPAAADLRKELEALGAQVEIVSCDIADSGQLSAVLRGISGDRPLTAVVHTAGGLADAVVTDIDDDDLEQAFRAKAVGAWNLHELTREIATLREFVLFSSFAGVIGSAGQAAYAAANTYLDALAERRVQIGLPARSLAWGLWDAPSDLTGGLSDADTARLARIGIGTISPETGTFLFDEVIKGEQTSAIPALIDPSTILASGTYHSVLFDRWDRRTPAHAAGAPPAQAASTSPTSVEDTVDLVSELLGSVLNLRGGHTSIGTEEVLPDLGLDSLGAIELRNKIHARTGVRLSATAAFEYRTVADLADHLYSKIAAAA
ncbi:SDR family NAD(P)-dependent oxidoreductase [Gordonia sp. CPCC 205333]|uniref:type I polyketide synthase n=1 Tax=Gordonia sp. CPCC 205333 TaxID=3140790 RepID=UPI003AF3AC2F